jgi:hypothetical protein
MTTKVTELDISELVPDDLNLNTGTPEGEALMEKSLHEFGAGRSILLDMNNRIIAGNKTTEASASAGIQKIIVVETTGNELVAVKRTDIDLDSPKGRELALADNATSFANLAWDSKNLRKVGKKFDLKPADWGVKPKSIFNTDKLAYCDFTDAPAVHKNGDFYVTTFWKRSGENEGNTLSEIKENPLMIDFFADKAIDFIGRMCGRNLRAGDWCLITTPKRRHKETNFATEVCKKIAKSLNFLFYEDCIIAKNRTRINPDFSLTREIKERNIIVFDDIITTGSTLTATHDLLKMNKNMIFLRESKMGNSLAQNFKG